MKTMRCPILLVLLFVTQSVFPHTQRVHQFIVKEAYELLSHERGNIPRMNDHIGGLGPAYYADHAWQLPFVTTGAWREDEEDVVFGYRLSNLLNNYSLVSISHFWDADMGDLTGNRFRVNPFPGIVFDIPPSNLPPYENAYDKLLRYANGGWILWFPDTIIVQRVSNNHYLLLASVPAPPPAPTGIPLAYSSLTGFYVSDTMTLRADVLGTYVIFDLNEQRVIPQGELFDVRVDQAVRDRIVWEVVGRMCHLLGDMSVPTHSRRDEHGLDPDSYENWVGADGGPYLSWTRDSVGHSINPYTADNDPLHYLMYTMQQQANHFGSNGPYEGNGNDLIGGSPRTLESGFLVGLGLPSLGLPTGNGPWTDANRRNIMNRTLPYAIRATAGLLYWFACETNLITPSGVQADKQTAPVAFDLEQNFPNPFNPSTTIRYGLPHLSFVTLTVYNALGQKVAQLVDEQQQAGYHDVVFHDDQLASGVYFYRLDAGPPERPYLPSPGRAGSFTSVKKLLLLK